jgi:hypothetical protein
LLLGQFYHSEGILGEPRRVTPASKSLGQSSQATAIKTVNKLEASDFSHVFGEGTIKSRDGRA